MNAIADWSQERGQAAAWFAKLREEIIGAFEAIEREAPDVLYGPAPPRPVRFERLPWRRGDGSKDEGGGEGGILKGRLFEKAGVHVSTVCGEFSEAARAAVKGAQGDGRFWASGISLIVHPKSPRVPTVHFNTRMVATGEWWLGGGMDLTPMLTDARRPDHPDATFFHAACERACAPHGTGYHARFKKWCDEYFFLAHRGEPRGVGGIFYDHLNTGDFARDFAFTQDVGRAFLEAYLPIVRKRMSEPWTEAEREEQLIRRGRYVEFNLLYDRGTQFGLKTGGNVETILSSLPPVAKWP